MALARTADLVQAAYAAGSGIPAFNVITLEHAEGVVAGAEAVDRPVILQISENAVKFHRNRLAPLAAATIAVAEAAAVPVSVHLDHVERIDLLQAAATAGLSSVMFDASKLNYDDNLTQTRRASDWAHAHELFLEAELGQVGGKDGNHAISAHAPGARTDPAEAASFVEATGVDALAVAVGSSHAMSTRTASLDFGLIARLAESVDVPLVLHGSSGVPDEDLRRAVTAGITKVNVGTILNVQFTAAVREFLAADADVIDPRKYLAPARDAIAETVAAITAVIS